MTGTTNCGEMYGNRIKSNFTEYSSDVGSCLVVAQKITKPFCRGPVAFIRVHPVKIYSFARFRKMLYPKLQAKWALGFISGGFARMSS